MSKNEYKAIKNKNFTFETNPSKILDVMFMIKDKYTNLEILTNILENKTITHDMKDNVFTVFQKLQRTKYAYRRFIYIWRRKHCKTYNTEDLFMAPFKSTDKNVITLFENNTLYLFRINELINSTNQYLMNAPYFFPDPLPCKNPYTNLPFSKSNLYNIYFAIKESSFIMPILFHNFFLCNFDRAVFLKNNRLIAKETNYKSCLYNLPNKNVYDLTMDMLQHHKLKKTIRIHKDFPPDRLKKKLYSFLDLYYDSIYHYDVVKSTDADIVLHENLHKLARSNPNFGRKTIHFVQNPKNPFAKKIMVVEFNDELTMKQTSNDFMDNHVIYSNLPRDVVVVSSSSSINNNIVQEDSSDDSTAEYDDREDTDDGREDEDEDTVEDTDDDEEGEEEGDEGEEVIINI